MVTAPAAAVSLPPRARPSADRTGGGPQGGGRLLLVLAALLAFSLPSAVRAADGAAGNDADARASPEAAAVRALMEETERLLREVPAAAAEKAAELRAQARRYGFPAAAASGADATSGARHGNNERTGGTT